MHYSNALLLEINIIRIYEHGKAFLVHTRYTVLTICAPFNTTKHSEAQLYFWLFVVRFYVGAFWSFSLYAKPVRLLADRTNPTCLIDMRPEGTEASPPNESTNNSRSLALNPLVRPLLYSTKQPQPLHTLQSKHDPSLNVIEVRYMVHSYSEFFAGYCAACTSITLLFPLNKLIFRQMLGSISFKEAFSEIKSEGLGNFYRGLLPPLLQKSTSYSIMFGTQNEYYLMLKGKSVRSFTSLPLTE